MNRLILILILLCGWAKAQTAMKLFNPAAREYIVGNTPVASNLVTQALQKFPDDEKLQKLKELIDQQQQQQDQQNQNQDQNQDKDQKQNQQNSDQQQNQQQQDQQQQSDQEKQQSSEDQEPQEAQPSPAQPQQAGEMSPEEAQQLLDAMKLNEKDQRTDLRPYLGRPIRVDKDW